MCTKRDLNVTGELRAVPASSSHHDRGEGHSLANARPPEGRSSPAQASGDAGSQISPSIRQPSTTPRMGPVPWLYVGLAQGKGRGIFARSPIPTGSIIAREKPLIEERHDMITGGQRRIRDRWEKYPAPKQDRIRQAFPTLADIPSQELSQEHKNRLERFMTEYSFHYGQYQMGLVYEWISMANHSCAPNACAAPGNPGTLRALKDIAEGDEITIMYTKQNARFKCRCEVCVSRSRPRFGASRSTSEGSGGAVTQLFARSRARRTGTGGSSGGQSSGPGETSTNASDADAGHSKSWPGSRGPSEGDTHPSLRGADNRGMGDGDGYQATDDGRDGSSTEMRNWSHKFKTAMSQLWNSRSG